MAEKQPRGYFELSDEDMKTISDINRNKRYFKMPMFVKQIAFTRGNIDFKILKHSRRTCLIMRWVMPKCKIVE